MLNPGTYSVLTSQLSANSDRNSGAGSATKNLQGILAASVIFNFKYGSVGGTCSGLLQTSPDSGTTWLDIARADFTTASKITQFNLEGLLSKAATAYADLGSEGVNDGILFDQYRGIVLQGGTLYVNSSLAIILGAR